MGSRLRQRWYEITGEKRDLPVTEIACKLYHNDLIQIDEEAYEKIQKKPAIKDVLLVSSQTEEKPAPDRTHFRAGEPSSLSVDELANWLAGPSTKSAIPQKQVPQTDSEWYDSIIHQKIF